MPRMTRIAASLALAVALPAVALAQELPQEDPAAEEALAQALSAVNGASFHFVYSIWPVQEANSPVIGEGDLDRGSQSFRYTVSTDAQDETADHGNDGEWILAEGVMYHDAGAGWQPGDRDLTYMSITSMIAPFESYPFAKMLGSPEDGNLDLLALAGTDEVDGVQAAHYRFATKEIEMLGTATYEAWIAGDPAAPTLVVLQSTDEAGQVSRVTYSAIGEDVTITAP